MIILPISFPSAVPLQTAIFPLICLGEVTDWTLFSLLSNTPLWNFL